MTLKKASTVMKSRKQLALPLITGTGDPERKLLPSEPYVTCRLKQVWLLCQESHECCVRSPMIVVSRIPWLLCQESHDCCVKSPMIVVSRVPWLLCQESHVRITVSYGNFHHMTYSVIDMSLTGVQPSRWQVTLHLCRYSSILQV